MGGGGFQARDGTMSHQKHILGGKGDSKEQGWRQEGLVLAGAAVVMQKEA